jgi:3-hydroxyacyl-[acyl-carrier-protein] dehydratase
MNIVLKLNREEVLKLIPHRAPFLFVDRVSELVPGDRILGERQLRPEEAFFEGHFPGAPIMPGVLIGEALAQASGLLAGHGQVPAPMFHLVAVNLKFGGTARPGDTLKLKSRAGTSLGGLHQFQVEASTGSVVVASGTLMLARVGDAASGTAPGA